MALTSEELEAWDSYLGQLVSARFDVARSDAAAANWARVADAMLVERRKRAVQMLVPSLAAWDGFFGSLIAARGGMEDDDDRIALACATAADAADAVFAERAKRA